MGFFPRCLFALAASACLGCAVVQPYEKRHLSRRSMESPFARTEFRSDYDNKVQQTASGAELPGGTPGGGCGCTQ